MCYLVPRCNARKWNLPSQMEPAQPVFRTSSSWSIANRQLCRLSDDLVPCSDMAGEILAVGDLVTKWKVGDCVCANLVLDHVHGKLSAKIRLTTLGGTTRGGFNAVSRVPRPCRLCPPGMSGLLTQSLYQSLVAIPEHLSYEEASTLPCVCRPSLVLFFKLH